LKRSPAGWNCERPGEHRRAGRHRPRQRDCSGDHIHKSILWAILHGFLGWLYVIWHAFTRPGGLMG
jgi:hypothetical protein